MEEQCFSFIFQVREENTEIMRWWSKVVATELAKIDEEIKVRLSIEVMIVRLQYCDLTKSKCSSCFFKVNITAAAAADKILELEQVYLECFYGFLCTP